MGGWNEDSYNFSNLAADSLKRKRFAIEILEFVEEWKFDGFDIDWEYPTFRNTTHPDTDKVYEIYIYLFTAFLRALNCYPYHLSIDVLSIFFFSVQVEIKRKNLSFILFEIFIRNCNNISDYCDIS